jgi:hypothetical protein
MSYRSLTKLYPLSQLMTTAELVTLLDALPKAPKVRRSDMVVTVHGPDGQRRILSAIRFSDGRNLWTVMAAEGLIVDQGLL